MQRKIVVMICATFLLLGTGCGEDDDSSESNDGNSQHNNDENGANANNGNNSEDEPLPYEGIYAVSSHEVQEEGCDGSTLETADPSREYFELDGFASTSSNAHNYYWSPCVAPDDCSSAQIRITVPEDDSEEITVSGHGQGSSHHEGECILWRRGGEFEDTGDGVRIVVQRYEYVYDTADSSECNHEQEHWNEEEKVCVSQNIYEAALITD